MALYERVLRRRDLRRGLRTRRRQLKDVAGTNYCRIFPHVDARAGRIVVISVIDNLMKGASGQAVQNMNVMLGLPEHEGLV